MSNSLDSDQDQGHIRSFELLKTHIKRDGLYFLCNSYHAFHIIQNEGICTIIICHSIDQVSLSLVISYYINFIVPHLFKEKGGDIVFCDSILLK